MVSIINKFNSTLSKSHSNLQKSQQNRPEISLSFTQNALAVKGKTISSNKIEFSPPKIAFKRKVSYEVYTKKQLKLSLGQSGRQ
jgi:hypothetical protein